MDLKEIARELEVTTTWHSGARGRKLRDLADALWEHAGGKEEATAAGNEQLATPGPGVRSRTTLDAQDPAEVTEVDSVGQVADTRQAPQRSAPTTPDPAAKADTAKAPQVDKT